MPLIVLQRSPQLGEEPAVGEGEPALEVLAEDHLGDGLDQGVVEDLGLMKLSMGLFELLVIRSQQHLDGIGELAG